MEENKKRTIVSSGNSNPSLTPIKIPKTKGTYEINIIKIKLIVMELLNCIF